MITSPRAVFFDVDGVLVDSLPQHLQICHDKAMEFGLNLKIPTVDEFRQLIRRGTKVSPMRYFFLAVGFPEDFAARAVADYEREFIQRYRPKVFAGVNKMLNTLQTAGLKLGLVTSNTRANVVPALGNAMQYFEESCLFFVDRYPEPKPKSWCLAEGALTRLGAPNLRVRWRPTCRRDRSKRSWRSFSRRYVWMGHFTR
jgi:phosphoglycolate phosphatase-like HAD superfamily hydrolase